MTNIFDTHAHYSSRQFDADRDAVMRALGEGGVVGVLECHPARSAPSELWVPGTPIV